MEIIPSILTNDPGELKEKVELITKGNREWVRRVQIDVVDGVFAKNKTIGLELLRGVDTDLLLDIHLMVDEPVNWVEKCVGVGADRVVGHVERMGNQEEFVSRATEVETEVGLALDLQTQITQIDEVLLADLDVILLMSVPAGFGGQEFDNEVIKKIRQLSELRHARGCRFSICVDGGVNERNIADIAEAGADEVAIGKSLWREGAIDEKIEELMKSVGGAG